MVDIYRNQEGYPDATAGKALSSVDKETAEIRKRLKRLLGVVMEIVDIYGFRLEDKLKLVDKRTGRRYR